MSARKTVIKLTGDRVPLEQVSSIQSTITKISSIIDEMEVGEQVELVLLKEKEAIGN